VVILVPVHMACTQPLHAETGSLSLQSPVGRFESDECPVIVGCLPMSAEVKLSCCLPAQLYPGLRLDEMTHEVYRMVQATLS
jgi:hypothetical protein